MDDHSSEGQSPEPLPERLVAVAEATPELLDRLVSRWARADQWMLVEGIALAWTLDPSTLGKSELMRRKPEHCLPEDARHYLEMARRSATLLARPVTPSAFIDWADSAGLAFHPAWREATGKAASERAQARRLKADRQRQELVRLWALSPYWEPEEGVLLAYDLDPKEALASRVSGHDRSGIDGPAEVRHMLDLALRAVELGQLDERAAPIDFIRWAGSIGVGFHADWYGAVRDGQPDPAFDPEEPATDAREVASQPASIVPELKTRERETLLKMVVGMAVGGYSWDPNAARNVATGEIAGDLARQGVPLDDGTILKWLRAGAQLLPRQDD